MGKKGIVKEEKQSNLTETLTCSTKKGRFFMTAVHKLRYTQEGNKTFRGKFYEKIGGCQAENGTKFLRIIIINALLS